MCLSFRVIWEIHILWNLIYGKPNERYIQHVVHLVQGERLYEIAQTPICDFFIWITPYLYLKLFDKENTP